MKSKLEEDCLGAIREHRNYSKLRLKFIVATMKQRDATYVIPAEKQISHQIRE